MPQAAARAFLDPDAYVPTPSSALPGIARAAGRLEDAIRHREPVCVWGDFDVDGQTSTTLLVDSLRSLGGQVTYHIPLRATEGHGIQLQALETVLDQGVDLLLTCDTGITAHAEVDFA